MRKKIVVRFFTWYINRIIAKDFSSFTFNKVDVDKSKAILLVANHFSWWDGFFRDTPNSTLLMVFGPFSGAVILGNLCLGVLCGTFQAPGYGNLYVLTCSY